MPGTPRATDSPSRSAPAPVQEAASRPESDRSVRPAPTLPLPLGQGAGLREFLLDELGPQIPHHRTEVLHSLPQRRERNEPTHLVQRGTETAERRPIDLLKYLLAPFVGCHEVERDVQVR